MQAAGAVLPAVLLACFVSFWPAGASAEPRWFWELPDEGISATIARRSLALELRELEVPGAPERPDDAPSDVHLFFLVTRTDKGWLLEMWDRGEPAGSRTVSAAGHPSTVGRRLALAAAELVRALIARRSREARLLAEQREQQLEQERLARLAEARRQPALAAEAQGMWLFEGAWLAGPSLAIELNGTAPIRWRLGLGWYAGRVDALAPASLSGRGPAWSQFELQFEPVWVASAHGFDVEVGPDLAVSAVHLSGGGNVDGLSTARDTWSARLGISGGIVRPLSSQIRLRWSASGGSLLRSIPLTWNQTDVGLGGAYVATSLALVVGLPGQD